MGRTSRGDNKSKQKRQQAILRLTQENTISRQETTVEYLGQEGKTTPIMPPDASASGEVEALMGEYFEAVQYGQVDDLTAWAQEFMAEANAILKKAAQTAE